MQTNRALLALSMLLAFALAACGSSQPGGPSSAPDSVQAEAASSAAPGGQYHAEVALVGHAAVTADGKAVKVMVAVTNDGAGTFGSATGAHGVNLGAHSIDSNGKIVNQDLARGHLPQIAPGATRQVAILLPVAGVLGSRVELLPVDEGVAWFDAWGTKPLIIGPFEACSNRSVGAVCDASGKPLPVAATDTEVSD